MSPMTRQSERSEALELPEVVLFRNNFEARIADVDQTKPGDILRAFGLFIEVNDVLTDVIGNEDLRYLGRMVVLKKVEDWVKEELRLTAQTGNADGLPMAALSRAAGVAPSTGKARWNPVQKAKHAEKTRRHAQTNQTERVDKV